MFDSHNIDDFTDVQVSVAGNYYHGKHKRNRMKGQNEVTIALCDFRKVKPSIINDSYCLHCLFLLKLIII